MTGDFGNASAGGNATWDPPFDGIIVTYVYTPVTTVPEPGSLALLGAAGLAGLGLARRRGKKRRLSCGSKTTWRWPSARPWWRTGGRRAKASIGRSGNWSSPTKDARPVSVRSNVRGWHSDSDFFRRDAECARTLKRRAESVAIELTRLVVAPTGAPRTFRFTMDAWANVLRNGGYNSVHNHPNSLWSGVYYVDGGNPEPTPRENGKLELIDPRSGVNMLYIDKNVLDGRYLIEPIPGLMVVFPSWLKHMVHPYYGKRRTDLRRVQRVCGRAAGRNRGRCAAAGLSSGVFRRSPPTCDRTAPIPAAKQDGGNPRRRRPAAGAS